MNRDARFCEACGTPVGALPEEGSKEIPRNTTDCLIVFNGKARAEHWGEAETHDFRASLASYAGRRSQQTSLRYEVLDLARAGLSPSPRFEDSLEALRLATMARKPRYLFIIGGQEDVPMSRFTDLTGHDQDIASDAGYSLLSSNDLGRGMTEGTLRPDLLVGRLPIATDGTLRDTQVYLSNVSNCDLWPPPRQRITIGVSCLKWEAASNEVASKLGSESVRTSPSLTDEDLDSHLRKSCPECLYFNVHGSDSNAFWVGEGDGISDGHPVVARPENFASLNSINVVGTEACYGARFAGLPMKESAVMSALANKTIAFFGSTRIAYGPHEPPNWGADTVVREFLQPLCNSREWTSLGPGAGDILARSKSRLRGDLCTRAAEVAVLRKTFLSFNLFGDPTLFYSPRDTAKSFGSQSTGSSSDLSQRIDRLHSQRSADLFSRIDLGTERMRNSIRERVNSQVSAAFPAFAGVEPQELNLVDDSGSHGFLLTYLAEGLQGFHQGLVVACANDGAMGRVYCFK